MILRYPPIQNGFLPLKFQSQSMSTFESTLARVPLYLTSKRHEGKKIDGMTMLSASVSLKVCFIIEYTVCVRAPCVPLPAGPVSCAPCDLVLRAEGVTVATMKGPALRTRLSTHHLGVQEETGR